MLRLLIFPRSLELADDLVAGLLGAVQVALCVHSLDLGAPC